MILINKVTPFENEAFQKDLIECILINSGSSFISNIVVFYNNHNIVLPKNNKVNLVVKNGFSDFEIIEYCKKIYNDEIFIFANPFTTFNNTLIHVDKKLSNVIKLEDCYIFDRDSKIDSTQSGIDKIFLTISNNSKIITTKRHNWIKESFDIRFNTTPLISTKNKKNIEKYLLRKNIDINAQKMQNKDIPKIDIIIVSVNYNDTLPITLSSIPPELNTTVVTTSDDTGCQRICRQFNVNCVISNRIYEDDAEFNKGKAINDGIKSLKNPDWILLLDSDIYLQSDFLEILKLTNLTFQELFICKRLLIDSYEIFTEWEKGENVGVMERAKGYGYFHLFNIKSTKQRPIFPENYKDASFSDLEFRDSFKSKKELDTYVVHLGSTNQNWKGRITKNFRNANDWGVVENYKIGFSRYGKFKIINSVNFNYHNGGWLKVLSELKNVNNEKGINFDCFLEKNFCWEGSSNKVYNEDWIGILHNPLDSSNWYMDKVKNNDIFKSEKFIQSLSSCKGLYVFSENEKNKLEKKLSCLNLNIEVNDLKHTTTKNEKKWSLQSYKSNKKIIHIGWWLRDIGSFYKLKTTKKKIRLKLNEKIEQQINEIFDIPKRSDVEELEYLNKNDYENLICQSVVYIKLVDGVAVNTLLECIERNTPILINRNESVMEYLGEDYPMFFDETSDIDYLTTDENLIKTSNYLSNIKRYQTLGRQIEKSNIYRNLKSEFEITTIFEPGDLENSQGGIYNPGFCEFNKKRYMISRVEDLTETERGQDSMWLKTSAVPYLTELDKKLNIIDIIKLDTIGNFKRIEDFRIFSHKGNLYSNHILIDFNNNIIPVISKIDIEKRKMFILGKIKLNLKLKNVEKNWVFFEKNNKLYLIYSVNPMVVFEIDIEDLTSTKIKDEFFDLDWSINGYLSSSTNPIKISNNRYIMGIHTRDSHSIYHQGFLTFDDEFNIIKSSKFPYASGGDIDVIHKNVIYTSSIFLDGNKLICFAGDGDTKTISIKISKENTWKELL